MASGRIHKKFLITSGKNPNNVIDVFQNRKTRANLSLEYKVGRMGRPRWDVGNSKNTILGRVDFAFGFFFINHDVRSTEFPCPIKFRQTTIRSL